MPIYNNSSFAQALMSIGQNLPVMMRQKQLDQQAEQDRINKQQLEELALAEAKNKAKQREEGEKALNQYYENLRISPAIADLKKQQTGTENQNVSQFYNPSNIVPPNEEPKAGPPLSMSATPYKLDYLENLPVKTSSELATQYQLPRYAAYNEGAKNVIEQLGTEEKTQSAINKALQEQQFKKSETEQKQAFESGLKEKELENQRKIAAMRTTGGKNGQIIGYDENNEPIYGNASQRLSQGTVKSLSEFKNFPSMINSLRSAIKTEGDVMGPIQGRLQTGIAKAGLVTEKSKKAADLNARYEAVKQVVAKGMEGGVLRAEDMPKYQKILGDITLKPEFAEQNLNNLEAMLTNNYNSHLEGLQSAGYNVPQNFYIPKTSQKQSTYSDAAIQQAKDALDDPTAPENIKAKARKVLGL